MVTRLEDAEGDGSSADIGEVGRLRAELAAARAELARRGPGSKGDRETALLRDHQHRVRNLLALLRSVFSRTVETAESVGELSRHFRGRLDVLGRYSIASSLRDAADLEELVRNALQEFQFGDRPGIIVTGPDVAVPSDIVPPLALALHELVTNALKFGALSVADATLRIGWSVTDDTLELAWVAEGAPITMPPPARRGFSRQFIEEALPYQLGAETRFELRRDGVFCLIHLPLGGQDNDDRSPRPWSEGRS